MVFLHQPAPLETTSSEKSQVQDESAVEAPARSRICGDPNRGGLEGLPERDLSTGAPKLGIPLQGSMMDRGQSKLGLLRILELPPWK